jgi:proteasome lid subunit RPN8/RPN11
MMTVPGIQPIRFKTLVIPRSLVETMEAHAVEDYPDEACGLLVGYPDGRVVEIYRTPNVEPTRRHDRYLIDPRTYRRVERSADERGLRILAVYHSHPDHPARPSETDRQRAWPDFVYIVLRVTAQGVEAWTGWRLDEAGQFVPFPCQVDESQ